MNVLIIEDETLSAQRLENMLKKYDSKIGVLAKIPSVSQSIAWIENQTNTKPDLIFMDIHLEDGLSFKIIERLKLTIPVIFTTAYNEYALRAFKANSVDYLLKPLDPTELAAAIDKFKALQFKLNPLPDMATLKAILQTPAQVEQYKDRFLANIGSKLLTISTTDIAYFTTQQKATFIKTFDGKNLDVDYSLDKLVQLLDPKQFFRINRALLISLSSIKNMQSLSAGKLKLELNPVCDQEVYVSLDRITDFKQWLGK